LVQVDDSIPASDIFSDYDYFSSYSSMWVEHAKRYCDSMIQRFGIGADAQVVEIASNDGYLLQHFKNSGVRVHGVDPAANVADTAIARGIPTDVAFFGVKHAQEMAQRGLSADLMAANNVLAHVPDIRDFVGGFAALLKPEGVATFEFPHIMRLIENTQFDTIYHEHFYYLSLVAVDNVLKSSGLRAFDVEELPTHGGSLRLFVCKQQASHQPSARLQALRTEEEKRGLHSIDGYRDFVSRIEGVKASFLAFLNDARQRGARIAAYGAAAKGNTFLNVCGVGYPQIIAAYDLNPVKQGKLTPGSHIPIKAPSDIEKDRPDYIVILPWNLVEEISQNLRAIKGWNGKCVIAVPETRVL
jgi:2-polyprenyl-3-methyl-5-hydroxy-6-metoxy-1,4-benzoquinol methylase